MVRKGNTPSHTPLSGMFAVNSGGGGAFLFVPINSANVYWVQPHVLESAVCEEVRGENDSPLGWRIERCILI